MNKTDKTDKTDKLNKLNKLNKLDEYLIYEIGYFVSNEGLMKMQSTSKQLNKYLNNSKFRKAIIHRKHPIVFNICDNFCKKCNFFKFKNYHIYFNPLKTISCFHIE